jgi:hypothetical protein
MRYKHYFNVHYLLERILNSISAYLEYGRYEFQIFRQALVYTDPHRISVKSDRCFGDCTYGRKGDHDLRIVFYALCVDK